MATTTPNFGWSVPTSTDLVKDGATAIETLGDAIDASLVDLKGGTTGQVLKKNSGTDMDFVWSADSAGMTNPMTTTGDTIYSSSGSTPARLGIGTTGQVLTVAGGLPTWATSTGGADNFQLINAGGTALTGATTVTVSGISGKNRLLIYIYLASSANASASINVRFNTDSGTNYNYQLFYWTASAGGSAQANANDLIQLGEMGSSAANYVSGIIQMDGANAAGIKPFTYTTFANGGTTNTSYTGNGYYSGTSSISSVSVISASGNLDAGTIYVYGA